MIYKIHNNVILSGEQEKPIKNPLKMRGCFF